MDLVNTDALQCTVHDDEQVVDRQALFTDLVPFVLRIVRHMGVRDADVEDVSQEVFIVVHRNLHRYEGRSAIRSWVFGIVFRVVAAHRRKAHVRREVLMHAPERSTSGEEAESRACLAIMDRALDELDEKHRAVFVLYELEGMPMEEIARAVGCPVFTAYTRLRKARTKVRASIEQGPEGELP